MSGWAQVTALFNQVPTDVWPVLAVANVVLTIGTWSVAQRRLRRAGERAVTGKLPAAGAGSATGTAGTATAKDTALTIAAMVPALLFWAMVLAGSFHGLVAFGRETLGWRDGWEYLVPGTLDGVSVTFAFLAFRAVRLQKSPVRCQRVVWGAAVASATVNFAYEYAESNHNVVAGGYLALLSLFGMVMFHEFLSQFEDGTGYIKRENPVFGLRWITWPTNTFCAAVAWRNYPPAEGTTATVREAVANLDRVRALKRAAREDRIQTRHERALAARRRKAELASDPPRSSDGGEAAQPTSAHVSNTVSGASGTALPWATNAASAQTGSPVMRMPATAPTVAQWVETWVTMCADGDLVLGPLNNNELARSRYGLSAKQLRNIRNAVISGDLRRRAQELGVRLPSAYVDSPVGPRVNGRTTVTKPARRTPC